MGCLRGLVSIIAIVFVVAIIGAVVGGRKDSPSSVTGVLPTRTAASAPVAPTPPKRAYAERLAETETTLASFDFTSNLDTVDDIAASLVMIDVFAEIAAEVPSEADAPKRKRFIAALSAKQKSVLPVLRDKYGPAMRKELWEADGKARTIGNGYRTVEFIAGAFAANRNIASSHQTLLPTLMKLRFNRAQYKWIDAAVEYSYYTLEPPADGDVGTWSGAYFRAAPK